VDLVVMDFDHLGQPQGWRLVRQLRVPHACRRAPKLAVLGQTPRWRRWQASMAGVTCLDKPLDPRLLDAWIVRCLGRERTGPVPVSLFGAGADRGSPPGRAFQFDGGT
jgi:DNA-binding response OmpR family regulator